MDLHGQHGHHHHGDGLTNGQSYTFRVRAANSAGRSAASIASASVIPATAPGAPTNIGVTGGDQEVDLSLDGARVERRGHDHRLRVRAGRFRRLDRHGRHGH